MILRNLQRESIDELDTFLINLVASSIRLISALVLELDLNLTKHDIQWVFAKSTLNEKIRVRLL